MKARSSRAAKAHEFGKKAREEIWKRDGGQCIFCRRSYYEEESTWYGRQMLTVMHYVPRSKGGLGIPENGAIGCVFHHEMMDNGYKGRREEMLRIFRDYLEHKHPGWNEERLIYDKWR